jgi:hypothetical protein
MMACTSTPARCGSRIITRARSIGVRSRETDVV